MGEMRTLRSVVIVAALVAGTMAQAQSGQPLRFNVAPGSSYAMTSVTSMKMAFSGMMDREMTTKSTVSQTLKFDAGEGAWLKFTLSTSDFKTEGEQMMEGMGPSPDEMAAAFKNVRTVGEVGPNGGTRNVKLEGTDGLDMMTKGMVTRIVEGVSQLGLLGLTFPDGPVEVGTEWKANFDMAKTLGDSMMGMAQDVKGDFPYVFTVEAFEAVDGAPHAKVKVFTDGKATFRVQGPGGEGDGNMTMTSLGHMWIDLATGLPTKSATEMAMTIDIGMLQITQEMKIDTTLKKG